MKGFTITNRCSVVNVYSEFSHEQFMYDSDVCRLDACDMAIEEFKKKYPSEDVIEVSFHSVITYEVGTRKDRVR